MAITTGTLVVEDGNSVSRNLKTLNDSADTSVNPGHPLINSTGGFSTLPEGAGTATGALRVEIANNGTGKVGIDQTTPGTTNNVFLSAPRIVTGATTTRPNDTTTYAAGDLWANNTSAGSVTYPTIAAAIGNDVPGSILRVRLKKSGTVTTLATFRVHLYNVLPSVTNGDNGAWLSTHAGWLGMFDVPVIEAFSDATAGIGSPYTGSSVNFAPVSGTQNLYYLIEVRQAYVPVANEVLTPILELAQ